MMQQQKPPLAPSVPPALTPQQVPLGGMPTDWIVSLLSVAFIAGFAIDGWAHNYGWVDTTFFTPWHTLLYSAFLLLTLALGGVVVVQHGRGTIWRRAIPDGYGLAWWVCTSSSAVESPT